MLCVPKDQVDPNVKEGHVGEGEDAVDSPSEGSHEEEPYEEEGEGYDVDDEGDSEGSFDSQEEGGYDPEIDDYADELDYDLGDAGYGDDICGCFLGDIFSSYTRPMTIPITPPPPRHLADPEAFTGHNAPAWVPARGTNHHMLADPATRRPALLAIQMKVTSNNFWLINATVEDMEGQKLFCVGEKPALPGFDGYWRKCMDRLEVLMHQFETKFPGVKGIQGNNWSFMQHRVDGIKLQQPFTKKDIWMYGLEENPYYADFLQHCPSEFKYIDAQASPNNPTRSRVGINPLAAHDKDGSIIAPNDYETKFGDREVIVEAEFELHHFSFGGSRGRSFIAMPHSLQLVDPADVIGPARISTRRNENSVIKREVNEEVGVKQEEYEEVLGSKGKRRAVSQGPRDCVPIEKGKSAELAVKKEEEEDIAIHSSQKKRRVDELN